MRTASSSNGQPTVSPPATTEPFWALPLDDLFRRLESSRRGLSGAEASRRRQRAGVVTAAPGSQRGAALLARQFTSPITLLLAVAAGLSMGLGEVADGVIILGILVISGLLGFWQERRASNAVARLLALLRATVTVMRDGVTVEVESAAVVPGDVIVLRAGSSIVADARLIDENDLHVDEAALTGESYPVEKDTGTVRADAPILERSNSIFQGTHVVSGIATALVTRTGGATEFGSLARRVSLRAPATAFELGVNRFGRLLVYMAGTLMLLVLTANLALQRPLLETLLFTLALAVGLTPQLLPAIVSVTLSRGAQHMARERVIVRRLASIEDLGGMTVLCSDKTGTITQGIVALHACEDWAGAPSSTVHLLAYLNASFASGFTNPIDETLRASPPSTLAAGWSKADEVPYDFIRKRVSIAAIREGRRLLLTKGALSNILDICETVESATGERRPLGEARDAIQARFEALSRDGYRVLGVAYRELSSDAPVGREDEHGMVFAGVLSVSDPLKPSATGALATLRELGIELKLITGDNRHVAARVAAEVGLGHELVTGDDFRAMSDAALMVAVRRFHVFAEVEPNQKERLILALRKTGACVGYLGDGINDASALHAADVGISVESAIDVTKEAADIVLLDKDLGVLSSGVREGRRAFGNTLKYVFITTSANVGNTVSLAAATLATTFLPMLPKQILLLNVLTDLPSMTIATDRLDPELVARPRRWNTREITRFMLTFGLVSSVFDILTFAALLLMRASPDVFRTAWFVESVITELLILLVIRTRRPFYRSPASRTLLWASLAVGALTIALPFVPVASFIGFAPLPARVSGVVAIIVVCYVAASELAKRVHYRRGAVA